MFKEINGGHQAELNCRSGHLQDDKIMVFCTELKQYAEDREMYYPDNDDVILELSDYLEKYVVRSVFIFQWGESAVIFDDHYTSYGGILAARIAAADAISKLEEEFWKLKKQKNRQGLTIA